MGERFQSDKILFARANLANLNELQTDVTLHLKRAFCLGKSLYEEVKDTPIWAGKSKQALVSFLHLIIQFQGAFINESVEGGSDLKITMNYCEHAKEAIVQGLINMERFPQNSECIEKMGEIR